MFMKDHSRSFGKKGVCYRTPSPFRANVQRRSRDQQLKNKTVFGSGGSGFGGKK